MRALTCSKTSSSRRVCYAGFEAVSPSLWPPVADCQSATLAYAVSQAAPTITPRARLASRDAETAPAESKSLKVFTVANPASAQFRNSESAQQADKWQWPKHKQGHGGQGVIKAACAGMRSIVGGGQGGQVQEGIWRTCGFNCLCGFLVQLV